MAIVQDILLQFHTDVSEIEKNALALAGRFQRSVTPPEQGGGLDEKGQQELDQAMQQRADQLGLSYEEVKNILQEVVDINKQIEATEEEAIELAGQRNVLDRLSLEQTNLKNKKLQEAAKLLGLNANASQDEIIARRDELNELAKKGKATKEDLKALQEANHLIRSAAGHQGQVTKNAQKSVDLNEKIKASREKIDKLIDRMNTKLRTITLTEKEREDIAAVLVRLQAASTVQLDKQANAVDEAKEALAKATDEQNKLNKASAKTKDNFATKAISALAYYEALTLLKRAARAAAQTLKELDAALTDIAVVTNMSREESWQLLNTYQEMAKQVGLTTTEVAKLSIEFFRQGREAKDALELTKTAAEFAKIAAIDVKEAANFLTAAINGFNLSASDASRIIDRFAALGAGAAASASEIAIALSKVAPAAASAGVEVDTLMAFVTKGIETTREAPENIGTAFKTIFARMRQLNDLGATIEDGLDVNRVDNALKSIGVELRNANGEFRDLDDVLIEVGKRWNSINRNQQAYVATSLAGTRQQTRLIALFEDFDRTLELIELSQNSAGAATLQHQEYMQGMEAATTRLKTSFQQLVTSFADSDVIIGFINALNTAVELLNTGAGRLILTLGILRVTTSTLTSDQNKWGQAIQKFIASDSWKKYTSSIFAPDKLKAAGTAWKNFFTGNIVSTRKMMKQREALMAQMKANPFVVGGDNTEFKNLAKQHKDLSKTLLGRGANLQKGLIAPFKALGSFLLSPLGIVTILMGLIVIFKKIRESTDTTNPTIARLKVVFDRIARSVTAFVDKLKEFGPVLASVGKTILKFFGPLGNAIAKALELSVAEEAAADMRVLVNQTKTLNKEIRETRQETDKLGKTLQVYQNLSQVGFKSGAQAKEMAEAEKALQDILQARTGIATSATGIQLIDLASDLFEEEEAEIKAKYDEVQKNIDEYFESNPFTTFSEALKDPAFEDLMDDVPLIAQSYAMNLIEGFDDMAPEVKESILRMIAIDPAAFLDANRKIVKAVEDIQIRISGGGSSRSFTILAGETLEEAFQRAKEAYPEMVTTLEEFQEKAGDGFRVIEVEASKLYSETIPNVRAALNGVFDPKNTNDFANSIRSIQNMDLELLTQDDRDLLFRTFPSLEQILDLPGARTQLQNIAELGGASFLQAFGEVQEQIAGFEDQLGGQDIGAAGFTFSAEAQNAQRASTIEKALLDILSSDDLLTSAQRAINEVMRGAVRGVVIPEEERTALANTILDMIPDIDDETLRVSTFGFIEDMEQIAEIAGKNRTEWTQKDLDLLAKYPQAMLDIQNGQFDINALRAAEDDIIRDNIASERESLLVRTNIAKSLLMQEKEMGNLNAEKLAQINEALALEEQNYNARVAELDLMEEILDSQGSITEEEKDKYKTQIDYIKAQKDSIKAAQDLRKLQQDSADIARKSLEATRIGAVGTIEAQFNQQQLNQEIARLNQELQDRMMIAQLEAQQKILEDSQQQAIQEATIANTNATINNSDALSTLTETIIELPRLAVSNSSPASVGSGITGNDLVGLAGY